MSSQLLYPAAKRNKPAVFALSPETDEWEMDRYEHNDNDDYAFYDDNDNDEDDAPYARVFFWRHHLLMPKKVPKH